MFLMRGFTLALLVLVGAEDMIIAGLVVVAVMVGMESIGRAVVPVGGTVADLKRENVDEGACGC